jgi:hypothetical protein
MKTSSFIVAVALSSLVAGCAGTMKQSSTRPTTQTLAFDRFVEERTESLYRTGGFKNRADAAFKAREEATHLYGESQPEFSTTWSSSTAPKKTQSEVNDELAKLARERAP